MKAIFNNEIINDNELSLESDDRAIQYGDGIFETIVIRKESLKMIKYHYKRLQEGASALRFELPEYLNISYLENSISRLIRENSINKTVRIKVLVWRKKGGYYNPESMTSNLLITVNIHHDEEEILKNVGISNSITNYHTPYSQFKTLNALKYIMASMEKEDAGFDDLIILDEKGHISELLYSNIFWIKNEIFYTPSIDTGCIRGVMRSYLIERLKEEGISLREVNEPPEKLYQADHVFATNASGIRSIVGISKIRFIVYPDLEKFMI